MNPLRRREFAPAPRTLVDIIRETAEQYPDDPALDNGVTVMSYSELIEASEDVADALRDNGVQVGDRVGIRIPSGTTDLYVAIIGTLLAGAAYVPVDRDDPDERAKTVFGEADVAATIGSDLVIRPRRSPVERADDGEPTIEDDAWIIFTSGSTGTPKGVAVTHRNAAAFVDAESRMFLQDKPIRPGDRVMAGLSVAFDASCEEMWLAWRYGACLVPAPRSLVRSGMDLGPWLIANGITIVSTVPTLVALWPTEALAAVRLLILGGEACPPEIGARLATDTREVWNTYGPTEATVVACGAPLTGEPPVRIGLPLDGWDLAVVDAAGHEVPVGEPGELIIGGVGLARYIDPAKDAEKYAPMPTLGWDRAYRSGDVVRNDPLGLTFVGRADDQVKVGGRRIELGEIDSALLQLPGVTGAAAAVKKTAAGNSLLVGYLTVTPGDEAAFDQAAATAYLRERMPAALVPRLAVIDNLPTRTSGKIDRDALPWPLPQSGGDATSELGGVSALIAGIWADVLGTRPSQASDDFFALGGGSLSAAQIVSRLRVDYPDVTVADLYSAPTVGALATLLEQLKSGGGELNAPVTPVRRKTQIVQVIATFPLRAIAGVRWLVWIGLISNLLQARGSFTFLPDFPWWFVLIGLVTLVSPWGRMALAALGARILLRGVEPGDYPRGGKVHLRVWLAERLADELGASNLAGAPWTRWYAKLLGARVEQHVDLHALPPITGWLSLGAASSIEPEVDLRGHWVDGDVLHMGAIAVGAGARVGTRSTLLGGADIGAKAEVAPGSAVFDAVPANESWSGAPAEPSGKARGPWLDERPANKPRWRLAYILTAMALAAFPALAVALAILAVSPALSGATSTGDLLRRALLWSPLVTVLAFIVLAAIIAVSVRLLGIGLQPGPHPIHGRQAWQAWSTMRVLDEARTWLFPLYSSALTPAWLRLLGATLGRDVEASTVLMIPKFTTVGDGAFLADDTLIGSYELGGGWLRVEPVKIGKGAFVGNSGMAAPGRKVPKQGLVAVLSAAPARVAAKRGTSWLGSPPQQLRRDAKVSDTSRTYAPPRRLRIARGSVELCRVFALWAQALLCIAVVAALTWLAGRNLVLAVVLAGIVMMIAGALAAGVATAAKWLLVGRVKPGEHPLWSSFVWRNELADSFVEVLAAPWFARAATGTPVLNQWLRAMGASVGAGVWCETYWLPEPDLIELYPGATVNAGCVVQTHLFHDRVLSMDKVRLRTGATLGPNGVILPAAVIGKHATVGPVSLVMRGESVPDKTRWIGNPIGPWV